MWDGMDRRRFPRVQHPCKIKLKRSGGTKIINTFTENIGCGGVCVLLKEDLGLFSPVKLDIDIEDSLGWFSSQGTIVWVVKREGETKDKEVIFDTGIEFNNLGEEYRLRVEKMVNRILAKDK